MEDAGDESDVILGRGRQVAQELNMTVQTEIKS